MTASATTTTTTGWFDADAHVIEPPSIWPEYTAARFHTRVPSLDRRGDQEWLVLDDRDLFPLGRIGGLARGSSGIPLSDDALAGSWESCVVAGGYDQTARLEANARDGVAVSLLFPTIATSFYAIADEALRWELLRAYNRWVADLCTGTQGALRSLCMIDPDDVDLALAEIDGARNRGHVGILVPLWADTPWNYGDEAFDALWRAAAGQGLPVGFHAFSSRSPHVIRRGLDLAVDSVSTRPAVVTAALAKLIFGGVFERVPDLRWFSAENDAGWCPYFLERGEILFRRAATQLAIARPPSQIFREHVFLTFTNEQVVIDNATMIGVDNLMWGSDYPHNVTTWPHSHDVVGAMFDAAGTPPGTRHKLVHANAARLFA